jgi:hypothetical protein
MNFSFKGLNKFSEVCILSIIIQQTRFHLLPDVTLANMVKENCITELKLLWSYAAVFSVTDNTDQGL